MEVLFLLFIVSLLIYFIPSFVALNKKSKRRDVIAVLNLFLGWTILGWVGALIWAMLDE